MKNNVLNYFKAFLPAVIWAGIIYLFSSQQVLPSLTLSIADFIFKKTAHMFVYAMFYLLLITGFIQLDYKFEKIWFTALIICFLYAVSDELHQSFVSGRTASFIDIGFDVTGASLVAFKKFDYI